MPVITGELKAHIHCHRADDIFTAIRLAKEFDLDFVLVHCTEGHLIAEDLAEEGVCAITGPLMTTRSKPELANATDKNPGILSRHGVKTAICTDYNVMPIGMLPHLRRDGGGGKGWTISRRWPPSPSIRHRLSELPTGSARLQPARTPISRSFHRIH